MLRFILPTSSRLAMVGSPLKCTRRTPTPSGEAGLTGEQSSAITKLVNSLLPLCYQDHIKQEKKEGHPVEGNPEGQEERHAQSPRTSGNKCHHIHKSYCYWSSLVFLL